MKDHNKGMNLETLAAMSVRLRMIGHERPALQQFTTLNEK